MQAIIICSLVVQALTDRLKSLFPDTISTKIAVPLLSAALGILVCVLGRIDLFAAVNIVFDLPIVGYVLTGVAASGGASGINELFKLIAETRSSNQ